MSTAANMVNTSTLDGLANQIVSTKILGYDICWQTLKHRYIEENVIVEVFRSAGLEVYVKDLGKADICRHVGEYMVSRLGGKKYEYRFTDFNKCVLLVYSVDIQSSKLLLAHKICATFGIEINKQGKEVLTSEIVDVEILEGCLSLNVDEMLEVIHKYDSEDLMQVLRDICNAFGYRYNRGGGMYLLNPMMAGKLIDLAPQLGELDLKLIYISRCGASKSDYQFLSEILGNDLLDILEISTLEMIAFYCQNTGKSEKLREVCKLLRQGKVDEYLASPQSQAPLMGLVTNLVQGLKGLHPTIIMTNETLVRYLDALESSPKLKKIEKLQSKIDDAILKACSFDDELSSKIMKFLDIRFEAYKLADRQVSDLLMKSIAKKVVKAKKEFEDDIEF